jgi:hypothetical protein
VGGVDGSSNNCCCRYDDHNNNVICNVSIMIIYLSLYSPLLDLGRFFRFLILYTVGRTPWTGDQTVARPRPTHRTRTQNKRTQTPMSRVGFEPTISAFERAKTVHALDHTATVIGDML